MDKHIFHPDQRDPEGAYWIQGGHTHCFEFQLAQHGVSMDLLHSPGSGQDYSLRGYFSDRPFGQNLFLYDDLDSFPLPRQPRQIVITPGRMLPDETPVQVGVNYYFHVQNLQNRENQFSLIIEPLA